MPLHLPHLRSVINSDGAAIFDAEQGTLTTLNATGAMLWRGIEQGHSKEQLLQSLADATQLPEEQLRLDIEEFLEQLTAQHLITSE
ncbi:PqqD family protein [Granulicella cerasi]|uniref:PqqD family protein n=1 Tax=Granulicella cerasi TaxID=741063 RepID=A0ABW1ZCC1_9BACT|nr:PqqD family protein [Granulicella cerasi]